MICLLTIPEAGLGLEGGPGKPEGDVRLGYRLQVQGPPGVERIVALASYQPLGSSWRRYAEEDLHHSRSAHRPFPRSSGYHSSSAASYSSAGSSSPPGVSFRASFRGTLGNTRVVLAGSNRGHGRYRRQLVPVPTYDRVFRDETWFAYRLTGQAQEIDVSIYTVSGRRIRDLHSGIQPPNTQLRVRWNGRDDNGQDVANGTYFFRLRATDGDQSVERVIPVVKMR